MEIDQREEAEKLHCQRERGPTSARPGSSRLRAVRVMKIEQEPIESRWPDPVNNELQTLQLVRGEQEDGGIPNVDHLPAMTCRPITVS